MAWNEPGGNSNNDDKDKKDPWSGKPKSNNPPDLEALLRDWRKKLSNLWQKKSGPGGSAPQLPFANFSNSTLAAIIAGLVILLWLVSGLFVVQPNEQAVILRFGKYVETVDPGLHWILWPVETAARVNIEKNYIYTYNSDLFTQDHNLVDATVNVNYRINNARDYLFNLDNPSETLRQITATALAQALGTLSLNEAFTANREQIGQQIRDQLTQILTNYQAGIMITAVTVPSIKAPESLKDAYDDVIKAQTDAEQATSQAQLFAKQIEPTAQGQAQKLLTEAKAYQQQIVVRARTDTEQFLALLPQYEKAPQVTRQILYLQTLETILANHPSFVLDAAGDNTVIKLPAKTPAAQPDNKTAPTNISAANTNQTATTSASNNTETTRASSTTPAAAGGYQ